MKVLHYLSDVDPRSGGVVRAVLDLCKCLGALDLELTLAFCGRAVEELPSSTNVQSCQVDARAPMLGQFGKSARAKLSFLVRSHDVVHLHTPWDPANVQLAQLCRRHGVPYIFSPHGMLDDWSIRMRTLKKFAYLRLIAREFISSAHLVHCTAEEERKQASKRLLGAPTVVVPLVLDLSPYIDMPGTAAAKALCSTLSLEDFRILFLSRIHPKKGLEFAIEAVSLLRASGVPVSLVIAGPGEKRYIDKLKALVTKCSLASHCHFIGTVQGQVKSSIFQLCQVLVLPTAQENFGLVLPEALAAGLPVITTPHVAIWRELSSSRGAVIVDRSAQDFAMAIRHMYDDRDRLARMSKYGRDWAMETFSGLKVAKQYEAMYRSTLA